MKARPEWIEKAKVGYPAHKWEREMEMDAHAGALSAVFGKSYKPATHERALTPNPGLPMRNGWDFGQGFPSRVWFQRTMFNGVRVFASLVGESVQLRPFIEQTIAYEANALGDIFQNRRDYCDPAGNQSKDDGLKSVEILKAFGWAPKWRGSRVDEGIEEIERLLSMTQPDGEPMVLIDPRHNVTLCHAMRSMYKRNVKGEIERIHPFVDVMDAWRYGILNTMTPERAKRRDAGPGFPVNEVSGYGRAPIPLPGGYGHGHDARRLYEAAGFVVNGGV